MKLRKLALTWHRYIGLTFGLLLVILGLTGSVLVFWREIDHSLNPSLMQVAPQAEHQSIDAVLASVRQAYPDLQLQSIAFPEPPGRTTYLINLESKDQSNSDRSTEVFVNPYTAEILGSRQSDRHLIGFLYKLHASFFAGDVGEIVVGICAVFLMVLGFTGLILWSGWRNLALGFKIRWNASLPRVNYDIHNVWGFCSNIFLIIIAFSGAAIVLAHRSPAVAAFFFGPTPKAEPAVVTPSQQPLAISKILQTADVALPGGETTFVFFANKPDQNLTVRKKFPQEYKPLIHDLGFSTVEINQYSGKVLQVNKVVEPPPMGLKILITLAALHFGTFWGLPSQILYIFMGLVSAVLFITGIIIWLGNRQTKNIGLRN
jgi:uncharacterized iron-regulated membrane protein